MEDLEQENAMYKETFAQFRGGLNSFQGNMNTIMEYLQAHKTTTSTSASNPAIAIVTDVIAVTTSIDAVVDTVIQPVASQPIYQPGPSRHVAAYPWGLLPNFNP